MLANKCNARRGLPVPRNALHRRPGATAGRFTVSRALPDHYNKQSFKFQQSLAERRGLRCANTSNRQNSTATTQLALVKAVPPPAHGRCGPIRKQNPMSSPALPKYENLIPVSPVKPASGYIGGKRNLAKRLIPLINAIPHECYAEPFVGMGGIFLRRNHWPKTEVINDWSQDVATFFRILQRHYVAFMDMLRHQLTIRARFDQLMATDPATLTDLERAARFLYLQRLAFGGKVANRNFGVTVTGSARFDMNKLGPMLDDLHERLGPVIIERMPFDKFITTYDRPHTLFYLDPPYYGNEGDYGPDLFSREDFARLADLLKAIQGRFILSINDHSDIRMLFSDFSISEFPTTYHVGGGGNDKQVTELVISSA
jgi:DNA adenine methylase